MMTRMTVVSLFAAMTLLAGCNIAPSPAEPSPSENTSTQAHQETKASITVMDEDNNTMEDREEGDDKMMETEMDDVSSEPQYIAYSESTQAQLHGEKPYVIFFHAPWCPICRAMEASINEELATFPEGTVILKADYDSETALKDEFDVKIQSTIVILDADGSVVWQGQDPAIDDLKQYIQDSLG